ncbi:N-6 DNA methylase [uncultured Thiodictyon sp.]|jgi:type I restriction enzyme M protein|uniref:HsdM family class I SAM-dependent methyltransferase n=1 Tax=uncultured Thiodictyon sp. TaxID=1846217 RepID=UPI0025F82BA5|nr:N-6 DNA methylase [uncultured Thiodictyon sp.]
MVEIIEPHGGTVFDPACGSGGMFVQSADFIARHRQELEAQGQDTSVYVYGQEKQGETVKLWINLFATSLKATGRAALVMANSASDARHGEADCRRTLIEKNLIYGMLTLPSNMFYTVTLPATLWFFDKAKRDARILFIDARNIFTQIDRAHRELTEEQVQNIAIISRLHKGRRGEFLALIDRYFASGMERLADNRQQVEPVSAQLLAVLEDEAGKAAVASLVKAWDGLEALQLAYAAYQRHNGDQATVEDRNSAQRALRATFDPFFTALHDCLKQLDRAVRHQEKQVAEQAKADGRRGSPDRQTKALKTALEAIHAEVRSAESWFSHIHWLQERFPEARYEDVTGLCKLAELDEVKEQDYSLNPGRYVGVVIEEDGKTDQQFIEAILDFNAQIKALSDSAKRLEQIVLHNVQLVVGEE